jgi:rRNA maturation protein Nop10
MAQILFNDRINDYTLQEEIEGVKSYRRVPIKFKFDDSTARFRKEILRKEIFGK